MAYLSWAEQIITDFSDKNSNEQYDRGFVFTRVGKGVMNQTRSLRINLAQFEPSSENRRILRKTEDVVFESHPLPYADYHFSIGKLGKDFYDAKFGEGTFSANKIKELLTDANASNFNKILVYKKGLKPAGYAICAETDELLHYSYPFYDLATDIPNLGLGMMLSAIIKAKEQGKKYVYLGSAQRPTDTYKLQFAGLEWFDGQQWQPANEELKELLQNL